MKSNYNFTQKILHDISLSNKLIKRSLFELEKIFFLDQENNINFNKHVFITGLPRSGTTILLYNIYSSRIFASLKYANMPFIMSPNISKIFKKKNNFKIPRPHNDNILFSLESPEAFDEVFFSMFDLDQNKDCIELSNYINLITKSQNSTRYLSKNSSNYKRIDQIISVFPNSIFLIIFRDPLQQSLSLLKQHVNFSELQSSNSFVRRYMGYLGHFEFGLDHKFWNKPIKYKDANDINYWLEQWILFYENMIKNFQENKNCKFVSYEKLSDKNYYNELLFKIDLENKFDFNIKNYNKKNIDIDYDQNLVDRAYNLYFLLKSV